MPQKRLTIKRSLITAASLFFLDAFVLNQGVIAFIVLVVVLPIMTVRAIQTRKDEIQFRMRLIVIGIYTIMAAMVFVSNHMNNAMAKKQAEKIVNACEQYKMKNGEYPIGLSALVPEFIEIIPKAKYSFSFNKFYYTPVQNRHSLMFVSFPPFGRSYYFLEEKKWECMD